MELQITERERHLLYHAVAHSIKQVEERLIEIDDYQECEEDTHEYDAYHTRLNTLKGYKKLLDKLKK